MLGNGDGADAWSATAVGNTECFMQIEVGSIDAEIAWATNSDEGVEIGAIHIDLAASGVDFRAKIADACFKNAVGGGVGDHDGSEAGAEFKNLGVEIGVVDISLGIASDGDDAEACENCAGWIGAVGGNRNEAGIALGLAAGVVPGADGEETSVLTLRTCVGLKGDTGEAGDFA